MRTNSERLFQKAQKIIPGGVNSPVRAFGAVGGTPVFIKRGKGSHVWDEDDREYIDYIESWGALIVGHAHPDVVEAVEKAAKNGLTFGAATEREVVLAELIQSAIPSLEKLRLVNSGTEAAMTAIRLARAYTGRSKILKFEGCYHGHADPFLVKAGSGLLTFGNPSSQGVPSGVLHDTIVGQYNDLSGLEQAFQKHGKELACVIVEPIAANMGVVLPKPQFLRQLRTLCSQFGALLIFDEVITGFRLHFGGYQNLCGINPDLTTLGKIIGGGLPIGAVGGKCDIMDLLAPEGPVYQAGTLSGNPIATAAGLATLQILKQENPYSALENQTKNLANGIKTVSEKLKIKLTINVQGSLLTVFFNSENVESYTDVMNSNREHYKTLFSGLLEQGVLLPPSPFEAWFLSTAHTGADITRVLAAVEKALQKGS